MNSTAARLIFITLLPAAAWAAPGPVDSDGDGITDAFDQCPATAAGAHVDSLGCPLDADFDGVPDGIDLCPDSPFGATVNAVGCEAGQLAAKETAAAMLAASQATAAAQVQAAQPAPSAPPVAVTAPVEPATPPPAAVVPAPAPKPQRRSAAMPFGGGFGNTLPPQPEFNAPPSDEPPAAKPAVTAPAAPMLPVAADMPAPAAAPAPAPAPDVPPPAASDAQDDHSDLLPLMNDDNALLDAIDRRDAEQDASENQDTQQRLARILHDHAGIMGTEPTEESAPAATATPRYRSAPAPQRRRAAAPPVLAPAPVAHAAPAPKPAPAPVVVETHKDHLFAQVPFAHGKSAMDAAASAKLKELAGELAHIMQRMPAMRVEVVGYADGGKAKLAGERAMSVNALLIGSGVPPGRIKRIDGGTKGSGAEVYSYPN